MRAIVAGYGYLGERIVREFTAAGFEVTVVRRVASGPSGIKFVSSDLTVEAPDIQPAPFDAAIFCLAPGTRDLTVYEKTYVTAQRHFLSKLDIRNYVYISSTAVYPDGAGTYDESCGSAHSDKARILLEAEALALSRGNSCVLRLAGLYDKDRPIYSKTSPYVDDKLVHFIHRNDAARAVSHAVSQHLRGIYNVHDGNPQRRSAILQKPAGSISPRIISAEKFFSSGFNPLYADYFAGVGQ